jgi:hypothetical protein
MEIKEITQNRYIERYRDIRSEEEIKEHPVFGKWRYIRNSMVKFQDKLKSVSENDKFVKFLEKILKW